MLPTAAPPAQAANLWGQGVDKLPLWGRYKWVEDHLAQIVGEFVLGAVGVTNSSCGRWGSVVWADALPAAPCTGLLAATGWQARQPLLPLARHPPSPAPPAALSPRRERH